MGYQTEPCRITRVEERRTGATCDKCGKPILMGAFGPILALEFRVRGDYTDLYRGAHSEPIDLLYCSDCAEAVIDALPGLRQAWEKER